MKTDYINSTRVFQNLMIAGIVVGTFVLGYTLVQRQIEKDENLTAEQIALLVSPLIVLLFTALWFYNLTSKAAQSRPIVYSQLSVISFVVLVVLVVSTD